MFSENWASTSPYSAPHPFCHPLSGLKVLCDSVSAQARSSILLLPLSQSSNKQPELAKQHGQWEKGTVGSKQNWTKDYSETVLNRHNFPVKAYQK